MNKYRVSVNSKQYVVRAEDSVDAVKKLNSRIIKDAKEITFDEYRDIKRSIPQFGDARVNLDDYNGDIEVTVSWASLGAKSLTEVRRFVGDLQRAISYAEKLESKYSGTKVTH